MIVVAYKERMRKNLCMSSVTKNNNVTDINYYIIYIYTDIKSYKVWVFSEQ